MSAKIMDVAHVLNHLRAKADAERGKMRVSITFEKDRDKHLFLTELQRELSADLNFQSDRRRFLNCEEFTAMGIEFRVL